MDNSTDKVLQIKDKSVLFIKNKIFDVIAVCIVIAMAVISLGIVELRDITVKELLNIAFECVPFYMAATMLSTNYYNKGAMLGKQSSKFMDATIYYSERVSSLTGKQLKYLPQFCNEYNDKALKSIQERLLHSVALTLEHFDDGINDSKPLKSISKNNLRKMYDKDVVKIIQKCKKTKIKGIYPNILLSNFTNFDITDLGNNEKELSRKRFISYAGSYVISIFAVSLIAVKNIMQWGWMGAALTLFKVLYIATGAYMKYFNGYEDITISVINHLNRKSDVLKEFEYWYSNNNFDSFKSLPETLSNKS